MVSLRHFFNKHYRMALLRDHWIAIFILFDNLIYKKNSENYKTCKQSLKLCKFLIFWWFWCQFGSMKKVQKSLQVQIARNQAYVSWVNPCMKLEHNKNLKKSLWPLLFLVYINDLGTDPNWQCDLILYADDTAMIDEINSNSDDQSLWQNWMTKDRVACDSEKKKQNL